MKRWLVTVLVFAASSAVIRADVTVVQTTTMEGGMASMGGGANMSPKITSKIKGLKQRMDVEMTGVNISTITDLVAKQLITLQHDQKTAQIVDGTAAAAAPASSAPPVTIGVDASGKPTGKSQVIDGVKCDEYAITSSMGLAEIAGGAQMPAEAAAMLKDVHMAMKGSVWIAKDPPGAAEYMAFQKAMARSNMASATLKGSGVNIPGMDKVMKAMANVDGMAYLTVMDVTVEGTGPIADMMRQMGAMKITMKVTSITADSLGDDLFKVPEGYTVNK